MKKCKFSIIGLVCCLMLCFGLGSAVAFEYNAEMDNDLAAFVRGTKAKEWTQMTIERSPIIYNEASQTFNIAEKDMSFLNQDVTGAPFSKLVVLDRNDVVDNLAFAERVLTENIRTVYNITYWINKDIPKLAIVTKISIR